LSHKSACLTAIIDVCLGGLLRHASLQFTRDLWGVLWGRKDAQGRTSGRGQVASRARGHIRQRCRWLSSSPSSKLEKRQALPAVAQYVSDFGLAGFRVTASVGDQHDACSESA